MVFVSQSRPFEMDINRDIRVKIITLKQSTSLTHADIAKKCKVSRSSVTKMIARFDQTGSISPTRIGRCGRKRLTDTRDDRILLMKRKKNARLNSEMLKKEMQGHGVSVSSRTIRRRLIEHNRPARKPRRKVFLSKTMRKRRLSVLDRWELEECEFKFFAPDHTFSANELIFVFLIGPVFGRDPHWSWGAKCYSR